MYILTVKICELLLDSFQKRVYLFVAWHWAFQNRVKDTRINIICYGMLIRIVYAYSFQSGVPICFNKIPMFYPSKSSNKGIVCYDGCGRFPRKLTRIFLARFSDCCFASNHQMSRNETFERFPYLQPTPFTFFIHISSLPTSRGKTLLWYLHII